LDRRRRDTPHTLPLSPSHPRRDHPQVLPDLYHVASRDPDERVGAAVGSALAVGFLLLQLYWSRLILRQILKRGGEGGSKASIRSREEASSLATAYSQLDDVRAAEA